MPDHGIFAVTFVVGGFVSGAISQCAKTFVDYIFSFDIFVRQRIMQNMISDSEPINLDQGNIIPNDALIENIVKKN